MEKHYHMPLKSLPEKYLSKENWTMLLKSS